MRNNEEESYQKYKQYRRNKYRYEQEQIWFPITIIVVAAAIISIWKELLAIVIGVTAIIGVCFLIKHYCSKQIWGKDVVVISPQDAREGVTVKITVKNLSKPLSISVEIPPNTKNGQKFVIKGIETENANGKKEKKNLHLKIKVDSPK